MPNSHRWRRKGQPTGVFLCGEFYEPRSLAGESPQGRREWTPEQLTFFLKHSQWATEGSRRQHYRPSLVELVDALRCEGKQEVLQASRTSQASYCQDTYCQTKRLKNSLLVFEITKKNCMNLHPYSSVRRAIYIQLHIYKTI